MLRCQGDGLYAMHKHSTLYTVISSAGRFSPDLLGVVNITRRTHTRAFHGVYIEAKRKLLLLLTVGHEKRGTEKEKEEFVRFYVNDNRVLPSRQRCAPRSEIFLSCSADWLWGVEQVGHDSFNTRNQPGRGRGVGEMANK